MDLTNLTKPNLLKLRDFIMRLVKLKDNNEQYLQYSVIVLDNNPVKSILNFLWRWHPPLNVVYMVSTSIIAEYLIRLLDNNENYI